MGTSSNLAAFKSWVGSVKGAMKSVKSGKPDPAVALKAAQIVKNVTAGKELAAIEKEPDPALRKPLLEKFLKRYPGAKAECAKAEDLLAKAWIEIGVEQAKQAYLLQAPGKADPKYNPANKYDLQHLTAQAKAAANADLSDATGSGLSEPEVSAIKTFTADDYKYLNPAVANQKDKKEKPSDWMDSNRPKGMSDEDWAKKKKTLYEEGALHAGVMMEGLKKMVAQGKMIYRGFRISPSDFNSRFKVGTDLDPTETFQSTSTEEAVAYEFSTGNDKVPDSQTVAVVLKAQLFDGRDIEKLSVYDSEKEILTLPGTVYRVVKISDMPSSMRIKGKPTATAWKIVEAQQVFK